METAGVCPLVHPRGVSAHFVRFSSGGYIIIGIGKEKTLEISAQYDIIEKLKFQCLASLCSQGVLFLPCGIDGAEKTMFKTKLDELGFLLAYPLQIFVVGPFCRAVFRSRMCARTHAADEEEQAISEGFAE